MSRAAIGFALAAMLAPAGCGRDRSGGPPPGARTFEPAPPPLAPPPAAGCAVDPLPDRVPGAPRVVAIGDLHGDFVAARAALRTAGVIDAADRWSGGATIVVQTGDVLDRGDDEPEILALLARLAREAAAAGGAVIALNGNHELMNAAGDFRYVTPGAMHDFDGAATRPAADPVLDRVPDAVRGRLAALRPGGPVARELAARRVAVVVGDTAFVHGGLSAGDDLAAINRAARCWLTGDGPPPAVLEDDEGPLWTRAYGGATPDCARLEAALADLGIARMVVGHTVQEGGVNAACDGRLWRIDVGMSAAYGGPIEVLELRGAAAEVLRGRRPSH